MYSNNNAKLCVFGRRVRFSCSHWHSAIVCEKNREMTHRKTNTIEVNLLVIIFDVHSNVYTCRGTVGTMGEPLIKWRTNNQISRHYFVCVSVTILMSLK